MSDYPCTGGTGTNFDEGELVSIIDINYWSIIIASSSKLTELVGKFVGGPR